MTVDKGVNLKSYPRIIGRALGGILRIIGRGFTHNRSRTPYILYVPVLNNL
jgi:hypothetical protein